MKKYKAIFFDWDGTAVLSRNAPVENIAAAMKKLLGNGIKLIIISGTTYEKIAGGKLEAFFSKKELKNLYLGLGRGAFNYRFDDDGRPYVFANTIPKTDELLRLHQVCFDIHHLLLKKHGLETDIIFSRPNYCKIDLTVENDRQDQLFLQENEIEAFNLKLAEHGFVGGLSALMETAVGFGEKSGLDLFVTSDAKFLEVGFSTKSDNVETILALLEQEDGIGINDCTFWGDEFLELEKGIFGSDSYMITDKTKSGDFFDVSNVEGQRPDCVKQLGGGVDRFLSFLKSQA